MIDSCVSCKVTASLMRYTVKFCPQWHNLCAPLFAVALLFALAVPVAAQEGRRLRAGYASLSGNITSLWAARERVFSRKTDWTSTSSPFRRAREGMVGNDRR